MKIRRGTKDPDETSCRWIEQRISYEWELDDLIDGLCSEYWRDRYDGDDPLPDHLSLDKIIGVVKGEYKRRGTDNVWTWSDSSEYEKAEEARAWARSMILAVLPDIEVPKETT